jgi:hypothetical protein
MGCHRRTAEVLTGVHAAVKNGMIVLGAIDL